jgi:hypothetical protein
MHNVPGPKAFGLGSAADLYTCTQPCDLVEQ